MEDGEGFAVPDGAELIEIPPLDSLFFYSDVFSNVEYIPLEMTQNSTIGILSEISVFHNGDIVVYDQINDALLRFSSDGTFLNRIGQKGHQKTEYLQICDVAFDTDNDEVIVWDNLKPALMFYNLEGNLLRTHSNPWNFGGRFRVLDDSHFVFHMVDSYKSKGGEFISNYKYIITPRDTCTVLAEYLDEQPKLKSIAFNHNVFTKSCENKFFCKSEYSPIIYEITPEEYSPRYYISYSEKTIPRDWLDLSESAFFKKMSKIYKKAQNYTYLNDFFTTDNYFLISSCNKGPVLYLSVQERSGEKRTFSGCCMNDNMYGKDTLDRNSYCPPGSSVLLFVIDNQCYFKSSQPIISQSDRRKIYDILKTDIKNEDNLSIVLSKYEEFFRMLDHDNPVLLKCTLK